MKRIAIAVAFLMIALPSVQSFAHDHSVGGFFRTRFIMADLQQDKDQDPDTVVDQRVRVKWAMNVDEYITFVYYGEIDIQYGDAAYATSRNQGGGASGDSVNLETKNIYIQAKIPDTPVTATIGLQGYVDHNDLALLLGDVAGVKIAASFGAVSGNVAWFKLSEGDGGANHTIGLANSEDDATLWALQAQFAPTKELTLNGDLYFADLNGSTSSGAAFAPIKEDLYFVSLAAKYKMDMATVGGWVLYTGGTIYGAGAADDTDVSGFAAAANASFKVAGAKAQLYAMYFASDDDATDNDQSSIEVPWATNAPVGMAVPFPGAGMMLMISDKFGTTYHTGYGFAMTDAAYNDYGLLALTGEVSYTPPELKNLWASFAAGYFRATEDNRKGLAKREGKNLGVETCARVGYNFGKLGLSLNGAYAWFGDFYDKTATGGDDPDNPYEVYAMANVNF